MASAGAYPAEQNAPHYTLPISLHLQEEKLGSSFSCSLIPISVTVIITV